MSDSRSVLVSGTRSGLGRELALHLLERGWRVAGCSRGEGTIYHDAYHHSRVDVGEELAVRGWVRGAVRTLGRIDAMVCNAAFVPAPTVVALAPESVFLETWRTNVLGTMHMAREAVRTMSRHGGGRIVAVGSMATAVLQPGTSAYTMSKAATEAFMRILAREVADVGVLCNVLSPSILETDALDQLGARGIGEALASLTLRRPLTFLEVGQAVESLIDSSNTAITGQVVRLGLAL